MLSISFSFSGDRSVEAMLHSVEFLCSVVVAFARLVHVLIGKVLMSLCSPMSAVQMISAAGLPPARVIKKVHPVGVAVSAALVEGERRQQTGNRDQLLPPLVVVLPAFKGTGNKLPEEKKTTAKAVVRGRPPTLVIPPVVARAGVDPFGEAEGRETEVEARGEGFCVASRRGVRHAMEDGYGVITGRTGGDSQLAFYGVYDGHGGRAAVDFVTDKLGKNIFAALSTTVASRRQPESSQQEEEDDEQLQLDVMAAIRDGYLTTDSEFLSQGVRGGACAATALVKDGEVYVANVGDCRAVLGSRGGVATALTADQTPARQDERHRIESLGGYVSCGSGGVWRVQDSLAVSRAFGDADVKPWVTCEPEIRRVKLTSDCRFLVLASDGLWNKVSNQEAVDVVVTNNTNGVSMESCKQLVAMARSRGSRDDITAMAVDLQPFLP